MGNSSGNSRERRTLHYYDQLPRSVRAALQNARFDWATRNFLKRFELGQIKAADLVKYIESIDRAEARQQRVKVWGKDYPSL
jgi:hypothetical protein